MTCTAASIPYSVGCVGQGIQHGDDNAVEHRQDLAIGGSTFGVGLAKDMEHRPTEEGQGSEGAGTSGEGLVLGLQASAY